MINGVLIIGIGMLTLFKQVRLGEVKIVDEDKALESSNRLGNKIFIPVIALAVVAVPISQFTPGALAMTAGFYGTLLTPMAANFNALPAALLKIKNLNGVIKEQVPFAFNMIVIHIVLMYFFAF